MINNSLKIFAFIIFCYQYFYAQQIDTVIVNQSLPPFQITVSYDTINSEKYSEICRLKISIYSLGTNTLVQEINDTVACGFEGISYYDINLDNYKDIHLKYVLDDYGAEDSAYLLYDTTSNTFKYASDFDVLDEGSPIEDKEEKIVVTWDRWYHGIECASEYKYKIEGFKLKLIYEEDCGKFDNFNYYYLTKKLIGDSLKIVDADSLFHIDSEYVKKSYSYTNDSLLLTSVYWANDKEAKLTDSSNLKIYVESEYTGALKCIRKEEYTYSKNDTGLLARNIKRYVVQNDKWVLKE